MTNLSSQIIFGDRVSRRAITDRLGKDRWAKFVLNYSSQQQHDDDTNYRSASRDVSFWFHLEGNLRLGQL